MNQVNAPLGTAQVGDLFDDPLDGSVLRMVPAGLHAEIREVVDFARAFNREVVGPLALETDRRSHEEPEYIAQDVLRVVSDWGLFTKWAPHAFHGGGYSGIGNVFFSEQVGRTCLGIANLIGIHYLGVSCLLLSGNMPLARRIMGEVREGERAGKPCVLSVACTEPTAGTDWQEPDLIERGDLRMSARKVDGGYVVNGSKVFISNGHHSTWVVLFTCTDPTRPLDTMVVLMVRAGSKGFTLGRHEDKMGQRACPASVLNFDECFVPDDLVLMDADRIAAVTSRPTRDVFLDYLNAWLRRSRASIALWGSSAAQGALDAATAFVREAQLDGRPMIANEWVQCRLAEMYGYARTARLVALDAIFADPSLRADAKSSGQGAVARFLQGRVMGALITGRSSAQKIARGMLGRPVDQAHLAGLSSVAKFSAVELGSRTCQAAMELMGAQGLRRDRRVEKILRDVKLLHIYEGTTQLNRVDAFKHLLAGAYPGSHAFQD